MRSAVSAAALREGVASHGHPYTIMRIMTKTKVPFLGDGKKRYNNNEEKREDGAPPTTCVNFLALIAHDAQHGVGWARRSSSEGSMAYYGRKKSIISFHPREYPHGHYRDIRRAGGRDLADAF